MAENVISHKTMLNILNDLSPCKNFYLIGFVLITIFPFFVSSYIAQYIGFLPFSISMGLASGQVKLFNDLTICYFIVISMFMLFTYISKGLSYEIVENFQKAARNPNKLKNDVGQNPKTHILYTALFLLFINFVWVWVFGFSNAGNSRILRNILGNSNFFINFYIILGFLGNLYLFIFSILMIEGRKHVMFLR